ncbi:5'-3' exoribonuclease 2 [Xylographa opegraphella]|nr:5'-3' exoribonuclease 2 [Xylographa opegraphella]
MGVPALFRWLSQKYPKIISPVVEEKSQIVDDHEVPVDTTRPNPNGEEFDNLYLDMNGIVHPCSHPEDRPAPATEEEMMLAIFTYTDRVVNMVRPRKLLMIAVDGVAPRAKQNQQRARRFRAAQEAKEKDDDKQELLKMLKTQNGGVLKEGTEDLMQKKTWDTNSITPGTPFMHTLAVCLRYWCAHKLNTDPAWEKVKIILSDASVPGEGEHKIMEFIRSQRSSPEHDPNTRHVIYGLDADLIMLGLGTHEPHFRVLREDVFYQESKARTCRICGQKGHIADACKGEAKQKDGDFGEKENAVPEKPFIWLHVSALREYLEAELHVPGIPFRFDLERALDDWIFMCFFVGNDFLPHLPSLDIRENGIDTLIAIWRDNLPLMGGYLTKDGHVDLERAQFVLDGLAKQEDAIFKRRRQTEEKRDANAKRRKLEEQNRDGNKNSGNNDQKGSRGRRSSPDYGLPPSNGNGPPPGLPIFTPGKGDIPKEVKAMTHEMAVNRGAIYKANLANKSAAAALKSQLSNAHSETADNAKIDHTNGSNVHTVKDDEEIVPAQQTPPSALGKRKADLIENDETCTPGRNTPIDATSKKEDVELPPDNVRLWEEGYADRYYEKKFGADPKDIGFRNEVARAYVEGLAWVLLYYFQGCPSWTWYYPYHYAPFAADFVDLDKMKVNFDRGVPYKPYEQLMGVLPAASNQNLPEVFRSLMSDENSEILDFYPEEFPTDLNGKKFAWQGVVLLPFIDMKRLLAAMNKKYPLLSADEVARNATGRDVLIVSDRHPLYVDIASNFYSKRQGTSKYKLQPRVSEGLAGEVEKDPDYLPQSPLVFPLETDTMPTLEEDHSISAYYEMPRSQYVHKSMLLRGVKLAPAALDRADIEATKGRANRSGRSYGGAPLRGNNGSARGRGSFDYSNPRPNPFAEYINPGFTPPGIVSYGQRHPQSSRDWRGSSGSQQFSQTPPNDSRRYMQGPGPPNQGFYAPADRQSGYAPRQAYYNSNGSGR